MRFDTLILDMDGVLTDGSKYIGPEGVRDTVRMHCRDNTNIKLLQELGIQVIVVTASSTPGAIAYFKRKGIVGMVMNDKQPDLIKVSSPVSFEWSRTVVVGDDLGDMKMMRAAQEAGGMAYCPADAHPLVRRHFPNLETKGGQGIVGELIFKETFTSHDTIDRTSPKTANYGA